MPGSDTPLVSALVASRDAGATLRLAVDSLLRQEGVTLEVVVVDDGSRDETAEILGTVSDDRLVVLRNPEPLGLARSLNAAIDVARGRYLARLDADDVALPGRLERQVRRIRRGDVAIVGSAVLEIDAHGVPGALHRAPRGSSAVAWGVLFGSPFFHPTTLLDGEVLRANDLRYDPRFEQAQDYDLWARLLSVSCGDNLSDVLTLRRLHAAQTSRRRRDGQQGFVKEIALRQIAGLAPELSDEEVELAWQVGAGSPLGSAAPVAVEAYLHLRERFAEGRDSAALRPVDVVVARAVMRAALSAPAEARAALLRRAQSVDPLLVGRGIADRLARRRATARSRGSAAAALALLGAGEDPHPVRVTFVLPEPTPYRTPLLDRVGRLDELRLTVVYAARTVAGRTWSATVDHPSVVLRGRRIPGAQRVVHHDYTITPGVFRALGGTRPDVVVVNGWSTFTAQAAILWCWSTRTPYLMLVSSHDAVDRAGWRRAVRAPIVPLVLRRAAGALVLGTLSREAVVDAGVDPERVRVFANTVDAPEWISRASRLRERREGLRADLGLASTDVAIVYAGRLSPEKGLETLLSAVAALDDPSVVVVLAGDGPSRGTLERLAGRLGVRALLLGDRSHDELPEVYVACDVFALLSTWERWGVVVNEAAACGLPLVLSDRVGAAPDLLVDGRNGTLVRAGEVSEAAAALRRYVADPELRRAHGAASTRIVADWGYEPSVSGLVELVHVAVGR